MLDKQLSSTDLFEKHIGLPGKIELDFLEILEDNVLLEETNSYFQKFLRWMLLFLNIPSKLFFSNIEFDITLLKLKGCRMVSSRQP